jgi:hypothetical protein
MAARGRDENVMAKVLAVSCKAALLSDNGHFARAAEKYAEAVAAAQLPAQPDCLIVTCLQMAEVSMLFSHAAGTTLAGAAKAFQRIYCVLLPATMAVQRRKEAGTLLPGACRAAEAAFFRDWDQHNVMSGAHPLEPAALMDMGSLIGYDTYVIAASAAATNLLLPLTIDDSDLRSAIYCRRLRPTS